MSSSPAKKVKLSTAASTIKKLTVVGGGNSTPIFAALAKRAGLHVSILTRKPAAWKSTVGFKNEDKAYLKGEEDVYETPDLITDDASKCIPESDMIFLAGVPIHHNESILKSLAPHVSKTKTVYIGSICAYGGFNWVASRALGKGDYVLFGTQLIPWTCGTLVYGEKGVVFGAKRMLRIATEDGADARDIKAVMRSILQIEDLRDTDFLACCLWPNNPSLHPPILIGLFENWDGVTPYDPERLPKFIYKDLRTGSAKYLVALDRELCALVAGLAKHHKDNKNLQLDYSLKACILENYKEGTEPGGQVMNAWDTVSCVSSNVAFGKHAIPYTTVPGGVVPTLAHKFFETDLTHGLTTWKDMALMIGMETPVIDTIIRWNQRLNKKEYLKEDGTLTGKDIEECIIPSRIGVTLKTLCEGNRS